MYFIQWENTQESKRERWSERLYLLRFNECTSVQFLLKFSSDLSGQAPQYDQSLGPYTEEGQTKMDSSTLAKWSLS